MIAAIAEQRIQEATARGEFDDLPGAGEPLALDDDLLVPEELRMAYRILKNAGFVPPEVELFKEVGTLERLIRTLDEGGTRSLAVKKLHLLRMQLDQHRSGHLQLEADYYDHIVARLSYA